MLELLHHYLLPHEANNHRPKLLHHTSLLGIVAVILFVNLLFSVVNFKSPSVLGVSYDITTEQLLSQTNQRRVENGLQPLVLNDQLTQAAGKKAEDMYANNYWAHNSPSGVTPWFFIKGAGYEYEYAGENLARGFTNASDVVKAWMESPGHRENLLSPNYTQIGFSVVPGTLTGDETVLVVQMFGKSSAAVAGSQETTKVAALITPSPLPLQTITTPQVSPTPTVVVSVIPSVSISANPGKTATTVASSRSIPLINEKSLSKNFALAVIGLILGTLIIDMILMRKRNIVRLFTHNIDHIIFFSVMLIIIWIIGKGVIL